MTFDHDGAWEDCKSQYGPARTRVTIGYQYVHVHGRNSPAGERGKSCVVRTCLPFIITGKRRLEWTAREMHRGGTIRSTYYVSLPISNCHPSTDHSVPYMLYGACYIRSCMCNLLCTSTKVLYLPCNRLMSPLILVDMREMRRLLPDLEQH